MQNMLVGRYAGLAMVRKNDLSVCLAVSLILHSLFAFTLWGWFSSMAEARPSHDIIRVSIIQAPPAMRAPAAAAPKARPRPKTLSLAKPLPLPEILNQEKKAPEPAQEAEQPVPDDAQDASSGSTDGAASGISGAPSASGTGPTDGVVIADRALANARDAYTAELYHIIRKYFVYPALARRRGQEGRVQVSFTVGDNGRAQDIQVVGSSGFSLLDRAAVQTIQKIPLPRPPRRAMQIPVTIVYRLEEDA